MSSVLLSDRRARGHDHADDHHRAAHSARYGGPDCPDGRRNGNNVSAEQRDETFGELPSIWYWCLSRNRNRALGHRLARHRSLRHVTGSIQRLRAVDQTIPLIFLCSVSRSCCSIPFVSLFFFGFDSSIAEQRRL